MSDEIALELMTAMRRDDDGTVALMLTISNIPPELVEAIGNWLHAMIKSHAHELGRLEPNPPGRH